MRRSYDEKYRSDVRRLLANVAKRELADEPRVDELKATLLEFGSHSEDNTKCLQLLDVISIQKKGLTRRGLGIVGTQLLLSDFIAKLEDDQVLPIIQERLPQLSADQWGAALRSLILILLCFEGRWTDDDLLTESGGFGVDDPDTGRD